MDVLLFVGMTQQGPNVFLAMLGSLHGVQPVSTLELSVDIGLVESPFQHTCLRHLQDCVVNGD